jgi:hypothetical protein
MTFDGWVDHLMREMLHAFTDDLMRVRKPRHAVHARPAAKGKDRDSGSASLQGGSEEGNSPQPERVNWPGQAVIQSTGFGRGRNCFREVAADGHVAACFVLWGLAILAPGTDKNQMRVVQA